MSRSIADNAFYGPLKALFGFRGTLAPFQDPAILLHRTDSNFCSTKINRTNDPHVNVLTHWDRPWVWP